MNEIRLDEGLDPYGESRLLSSAAQRHADDLAQNGFIDADDVHRGSDGTSAEDRIEEAGYASWADDGDRMVVAENVWTGQGSPQDALAVFLEDQDDREDLLSAVYREIGVGAATDTEGRSVYVLDFGARPNVLPIFINDGAASTENPEVAIRLTNERAQPEGEGTTFIGEAIGFRISDEPSFEDLTWEPWAPLISWVLPVTPGEHTVYVQFRDAAGRTAASADSIFLDEGTPATPSVVPTTRTPTPSATDSATPRSAPSGPTATHEEPTDETQPTTSRSGVAAAPSTSAPLVSRATPFPTWTPLPSPVPTPLDLDDPSETALWMRDMHGYGRPLAAVGILQGLVIVLGIYWILRRGKGT